MITVVRVAVLSCLLFLSPLAAFATNGDNLMGVGPISRGMGGTGIAAPQDAISATFANPAAMCIGPYCPMSQFDFAATIFTPTVDAKITAGGNRLTADSEKKSYLVPAFGITVPVGKDLRLGLSAYGVTGLGVDYRNTSIQGMTAADATQLMILKVAPTLAYQVNDRLSLGIALHIVNSSLDLSQGSSSNYGIGGQVGALYRAADNLTLGVTYISPINVNHEQVYNLDEATTGSKTQDDFELESPQTVGMGVAYKPSPSWLLETDVKWLNWANAKGYDALDWSNQWAYSIGVQYKPSDRTALRLGYNYAKNQVKEHHGFDGSGVTMAQGKAVNTYGFETLRVIGFPAIPEHHITAGCGWEIFPAVLVNLGYTHAFKHSIKGNGTLPDGTPVGLESSLSEDSLDASVSWRF